MQKIWKDYKGSGNAVTSKAWNKEREELRNNIKFYKWEMEQFRDELGRAEKIAKRLEKMQIDNDRVKPKSTNVEI